jgi:hypothetical protein
LPSSIEHRAHSVAQQRIEFILVADVLDSAFHLAAEVRLGVEPEAVLVGVEIVQPIAQAFEHVLEQTERLAGLRGAEQDALGLQSAHGLRGDCGGAAGEDGAHHAPGGLHAAEAGVLLIDLEPGRINASRLSAVQSRWMRMAMYCSTPRVRWNLSSVDQSS